MRTNKYFSLGFWHSSRAGGLFILVLVWLLLPFFQASAQKMNVRGVSKDSTSFLFTYRKQSGILLKYYAANDEESNRMLSLIKRHRRDIFSGKSHLSIAAYIQPADLKVPWMINNASIQASMVRTYIKVWTLVPLEAFTFVFDTVHHVNYQVRVDYITSPVPPSANRVIHYTLNRNPANVLYSVKRYRFIPLAKVLENEHDSVYAKPQSGRLATAAEKPIVAQQQKGTGETKQSDSAKLQQPAADTTKRPVDTLQQQPTDPTKPAVADQQQPARATVKLPAVIIRYKGANPVKISVKSNLLYWVGITPETEYHEVLPNAELEWYFGKRWSLNADATYTYAKKSVVDKEIWGLSSIALEPRFWLRGNRRFTGFYAGVYGLTGDFDVKLNSISAHGYTGTFNEGGVSLGYFLPLTSRWGVEAGARFGYRMVDCDTYKYVEPNHYYKQSSFTQNDFKVTGIRLLVTYRLWNSAKK